MSNVKSSSVIIFNGSRDTLKFSPNAKYQLISREEIWDRVERPSAKEKSEAPAIIPSSYCEFDGRTHAVQRERGIFQYLCVDVDKGSPTLDDVNEALTSVLGPCAAVIYSTSSASPENQKWRILIPLSESIPGSLYSATASAFYDLLEEQKLICDRSLDRTGQPVYLPNVPPDRRAGQHADGEPNFYRYRILSGMPIDLANTEIPDRREKNLRVETERYQNLRAESERRKTEFRSGALADQDSLIDRFNAMHDLEEVMESVGYTYDGRGNWRSPLQQGKTFATKTYGSKWYSLSTSDCFVGASAKSGGNFGDAFDLYVYYQHNGDIKSALCALGKEKRASEGAEMRAFRQGEINQNRPEADQDSYVPTNRECSDLEKFEAALKVLSGDAENKEKITDAIKWYSRLGALDKVLTESRLCKTACMTKSELRSIGAEIAKQENGPSDFTHSEMADILLGEYLTKADGPIGNAGALFFYDQSGLWRKRSLEEMRVLIGRRFREQDNAKRNSDYGGVAKLVYQSVLDEDFFTSADPGICTANGFWKVSGKEVVLRPHSKENRARFQLKVEPDFTSEPSLFLSVLDDAFVDLEDESQGENQKRLVRQLFGAAILGLQPSLQRAIFLFGASGSGKSVVLRVLESLFDPQDVTVVSPYELDQDYKKATLAHKRLNIVPELDGDNIIPSAAFKAALGEDRLNARLPYEVPFTFKCEAACWFNGNVMPSTRDHGDAFFRRWLIIHFKNTKPEKERDPKLVEGIITTELGKIAAWAIEGARDLLANGLALTQDHQKQLALWRQEASSVASWLADNPDVSEVAVRGYEDERSGLSKPIRRSDAYRCYKRWCSEANRKAFGRSMWGAEMARLGHTEMKTGGDFVFLTLKRAGAIQFE